MDRRTALSLMGVLVGRPFAFAEDGSYPYGRFVGEIEVRFDVDGRHVWLLKPVTFIDTSGYRWIAPAGARVDGASIPPWAWPFIGGPFEGRYRDASIIHDVFCDMKVKPWRQVHTVFYDAMRAREVETWRAKAMYWAVYRFGPRWNAPVSAAEQRPLTPDEFKEIANYIRVREVSARRDPVSPPGKELGTEPSARTERVEPQSAPEPITTSELENYSVDDLLKAAKNGVN